MGTPRCEVVVVIDDQCLVDSESYQRRYRSRRRLEPGCYLVVWPTALDIPQYDEAADYVGPFESKRLAELARESWGIARVRARTPTQ
jgi:hypothetical protein